MSSHVRLQEPAPCPRCGGPSVRIRDAAYPSLEGYAETCGSCQRDYVRRSEAFTREWQRRFGDGHQRLRRVLHRHYVWQHGGWYGGFDALLLAPDRELLDILEMGPARLRELRALWPTPLPPTVPRDEPDGPCLQSHGALSWVGG